MLEKRMREWKAVHCVKQIKRYKNYFIFTGKSWESSGRNCIWKMDDKFSLIPFKDLTSYFFMQVPFFENGIFCEITRTEFPMGFFTRDRGIEVLNLAVDNVKNQSMFNSLST